MITFHTPDDVLDRAHAAIAAQRKGTVERMADTMTVMAVNGEPVTADSLRLRGYTTAEVAEHGAAAADLATALRRARAL